MKEDMVSPRFHLVRLSLSLLSRFPSRVVCYFFSSSFVLWVLFVVRCSLLDGRV